MPPFLTKKYAGLPMWAWLALAATGVTVGLILRSRNASAVNNELGEDPCDPESETYDPSKCNQVESTQLQAGYDSADPCDPRSVTYDPTACQATAGIGYESAGGAGGPGGVFVEAPTASELGTAEEGGVELGSQPLVQITQNINPTRPCNKKKKPPNKKGYKLVCAEGRWLYESEKHAAKRKHKQDHSNLTGGGPPRKKHNKTGHHGKRRRKHKVRA